MENIKILEDEIKNLKSILRLKEHQLWQLKQKGLCSSELSTSEITRYSRQIIMPQIGMKGQLALKNGKVLIVGAGGLGCPAALYMAAAGVGNITIIDYDEVELTNLHRQILHSELLIGIPKVQSAYNVLTSLNSNINIIPMMEHANSETITKIMDNNNYDVIVDCTDNVATRYLLSDVSVFKKTPLVSGSALQMEGQLTVYNYKQGPCYRCIFPKPPPPETVTNCGDGGVLGMIPGTIGVLQALEAIKILIGNFNVLSGRLLLFDGADTVFRNVKLRSKNPNCDVCGDVPRITSPIDYEQFCGSKAHDKVVDVDLLDIEDHVNVKKVVALLGKEVVIDVRPELEFSMCNLPHTINIPYSQIIKLSSFNQLEEMFQNHKNKENVYFICRRGNDSQRTVKFFKDHFPHYPCKFYNIQGGLHAFHKYVDNSFPLY